MYSVAYVTITMIVVLAYLFNLVLLFSENLEMLLEEGAFQEQLLYLRYVCVM